MRVRRSRVPATKIEQPLTALIDVVFQLLTFFVMSFKVVSLEGDFHLTMAAEARPQHEFLEPTSPPLKLRMQAAPDGKLRRLSLNGREIRPALGEPLRAELHRVLDPAIKAVELEIYPDEQLRYEYIIGVMEAVSQTAPNKAGRAAPAIKVKLVPAPRK